jgi:ubiquinone/menaquinone biosynthesis C-methylase UbiE
MAQMKFLDPPMPDIIDQWRYYFSLLRPEKGHRIIDVGSGAGDAVHLLLKDHPAITQIVGVDSNYEYCETAISLWKQYGSPDNIEIKAADAQNLPFSENNFDRAICAEMLEYVADPAVAISEILRVLKQGGIALIIHSDFDTQVFQAGDRDRTRKIVNAFSDSGPNGQMGRELYGLCRGAGFASVEALIYPFIGTSWEPNTYAYQMSHMMVEWLTRKAMVPASELTQWLSDLEQAYADGIFFYSINRYICVCAK